MKKILSMILAVLMLAGLCACGGDGEGSGDQGAAASFQVGFGRENITPDFPVALSGGGDPNRISESVIDYIYTTCVAITDPTGKTVLVITSDLQSTPNEGGYQSSILTAASDATGVPKENILLCATHNHSGPSQSESKVGGTEFKKLYMDGIAAACKKAMEDRAPATMSAGEIKADGYVFPRHYKMMDGTFAGSSYGNLVAEQIESIAYEGDSTLQMVQFTREGKKPVLMMNLGAHATYFSSTTIKTLSSDFPGPLREHIEGNSDVLVAYFIGAAGDQTPSTKYAPKAHGLDHRAYGKAVGQLVVDALPSLKSVNTGDIKLQRMEHTGKTNYKDTDRLLEAKDIYDLFLEQGYSAGNSAAKAAGFISVYDCRSIVNRSKMPKTQQIELGALSFGDVSFVFASFEMFSDTGRYIRENSPYDMTFICTLSLGSHDYIPSDIGFELNCYEAYTAFFEQDTAKNIADQYIATLKDMKG